MERAAGGVVVERTAGSFADLTLAEFAARLSSTEPVPGGGSASAIAAALGASLAEMVAGLSLNRPKYAPYRATIERALGTASRARARFFELADADAAAYARFTDARRAAKQDGPGSASRQQAVAYAARSAADVPLGIVRECRDLAADIEALVGRSNVNAASDLNVAALLVEAAAKGAGANVLINLPAAGDEGYAGRATEELQQLLKEVDHLSSLVREATAELREPEPE